MATRPSFATFPLVRTRLGLAGWGAFFLFFDFFRNFKRNIFPTATLKGVNRKRLAVAGAKVRRL